MSRFRVHLNARLFSPLPPLAAADDDIPRSVDRLSLVGWILCGAGNLWIRTSPWWEGKRVVSAGSAAGLSSNETHNSQICPHRQSLTSRWSHRLTKRPFRPIQFLPRGPCIHVAQARHMHNHVNTDVVDGASHAENVIHPAYRQVNCTSTKMCLLLLDNAPPSQAIPDPVWIGEQLQSRM